MPESRLEVTLSEQILTELWMKFILLATNASITAATRQQIGKLRDDPDIRPMFIAAYRETIDVGRAKGIALPANALEKVLEFNAHAPPTMKASMALDLDRGNRLELPWLGGKVVELGRAAWRADADSRHAVRDAEALHHGGARLSGAPPIFRSRRYVPPHCGTQ